MKTKRFGFPAVIIAIALLCGSSFAQVSVKPGITVGLSAFKIRESSPSSSSSYEADNTMGFVAGGLLDISLLKVFSVEPGIAFSMRGAYHETKDYYDYQGNSTTVPIYYKSWLKFNYLEIPLHAKLKYPGIPVVDPYLLAGVNFGILLSANARNEVTGQPTEETDWKSKMNALDFGFDLGFGLELDLPFVVPCAEFVYYQGVANVAKKESTDEDFTVKNKGMEIKGGLKFKL